jgi:hypothetical protein
MTIESERSVLYTFRVAMFPLSEFRDQCIAFVPRDSCLPLETPQQPFEV